MSRIVSAINAMIANQSKISKVKPGASSNNEIFFIYNNKYVWSVGRSEGKYKMWFYPGGIEQYADLVSHDGTWEGIPMVSYLENEFATPEARQSIQELHRILSEKQFGMDAVLDDIIRFEE